MGYDFAPAPDAGMRVGRNPQQDFDAPAAPGKQTLVDQSMQGTGGGIADIVAGLKYCAGMVFTDHGGYYYSVQADGTFRIVAPSPTSVGAHVAITDDVWLVLVGFALNDPGAIVANEPKELAELNGVTAPSAPAAPKAPAPVAPKPTPGVRGIAKAGLAIPKNVVASTVTTRVDVHEVYQLDSSTFAPIQVGQLGCVTCAVVEARSSTDGRDKVGGKQLRGGDRIRALEIVGRIVRVEQVDASLQRIGEFGWIRMRPILPLNRAPTHTRADDQMRALLAAAHSANGGGSIGMCYAFVKNYIALAGGYGDIADIRNDARFVKQQGRALDFASVVEAIGPANVGLRRVGGPIAAATPGTILITKGNGDIEMGKDGKPRLDKYGNPKKVVNISETDGDIAVIDGVYGDYVHAINDGVMPIPADPSAYDAKGRFHDVLVAMYQPIDRD